jgi:two-component system phosphate regulon response regulator PhoB
MSKSNILIVEDESDLAELVSFHLTRDGHQCRRAADGERAVAEAQRQPPDLVILDRMLPRLSGDEVAQRLKRDPRTAGVPILMLTAKAADEDELVGFALGADDYVRKPFAVKLLLARVTALLRRKAAENTTPQVLAVGPVVLDHARHEVTVAERPVVLTATEFRILAVLMGARGRVLSRDQLIDAALGQGAPVTSRAMDVHIAALRKKLDSAGPWIHTIRGVGYAFRSPETPPQPDSTA